MPAMAANCTRALEGALRCNQPNWQRFCRASSKPNLSRQGCGIRALSAETERGAGRLLNNRSDWEMGGDTNGGRRLVMTDWRLDGVWAETSLFFGVAEMERVSVGCTDAPSLRTVCFRHGAKATPAHT